MFIAAAIGGLLQKHATNKRTKEAGMFAPECFFEGRWYYLERVGGTPKSLGERLYDAWSRANGYRMAARRLRRRWVSHTRRVE